MTTAKTRPPFTYLAPLCELGKGVPAEWVQPLGSKTSQQGACWCKGADGLPWGRCKSLGRTLVRVSVARLQPPFAETRDPRETSCGPPAQARESARAPKTDTGKALGAGQADVPYSPPSPTPLTSPAAPVNSPSADEG